MDAPAPHLACSPTFFFAGVVLGFNPPPPPHVHGRRPLNVYQYTQDLLAGTAPIGRYVGARSCGQAVLCHGLLCIPSPVPTYRPQPTRGPPQCVTH